MATQEVNQEEARLQQYKGQSSYMALNDVLAARCEVYRDRLERSDDERIRGQLKELRSIMQLLK